MPTHFIKRLNMREQLIREVEIIPLEVVVRNVAADLVSRIGATAFHGFHQITVHAHEPPSPHL